MARSGIIINIGSINIDEVFHVDDIVREGQTISSRGFSRSNGGKGANQSVAVALAEGTVVHIGRVGRDGHHVVRAMRDAGVDVENVMVDDEAATGRAIIQVNSRGNNAIVLHPGTNHLLRRGEVVDAIEKILRQASAASSSTEVVESGLAASPAATSSGARGDLPHYLLLQNEVNGLPWLITHGKDLGTKCGL